MHSTSKALKVKAASRIKAADEDYRYSREWLWKGDNFKRAQRLAMFVLEESRDEEARQAAKALYSSSFLCTRGDLIRVLKVCSRAVAECGKHITADLTKVVKDAT